MKQKLIDKMIGKRFGKLTIIDFVKVINVGNSVWKCKCDCDDNKIVIISLVRMQRNRIPSCGCSKEEVRINRAKKMCKINRYDLSNEYGIGYTFKNEEFYFDLEDYNKIKNYCWNKTSLGYISSTTRKTEFDNQEQIFMHRLVLDLPNKYQYGDLIGEHKNRKPEDNRKSNLSISDQSGNMTNKSKYKNNTSGHRGVNFTKGGKWLARLWYKNKNVLYKECNTFEESVVYREEAELKYFGKILD